MSNWFTRLFESGPALAPLKFQSEVKVIRGFYEGFNGRVVATKQALAPMGSCYIAVYQVRLDARHGDTVEAWFSRHDLELVG